MNIRTKKNNAFTLMETIVTIVIYAVMLLMITNIVLMNARLSEQLKVRSRIRTEMSQIVSLIKRDVRNATSISMADDNCSGSVCVISYSDFSVEWKWDKTNNRIVKSVTNLVTKEKLEEYLSGEYISIDGVDFSLVPGTDTLEKRVTVILTITASGKKSIWNVSNQVNQEIISTRNYELAI